MPDSLLGIKISIVRYISDEPQPGIVECHVEDAYGHRWSVVEKTAMVSTQSLDINSAYPQQRVIACEIVHRSLDADGHEIVRVDTERPWHVESVDGVTQFDVSPESLTQPHG